MRNRIVGLEQVRAAELDEHPLNFRQHPTEQREMLKDVLERIGIAGAALAYRSEATGRLTLIDGHLRREVLGDEPLPVLVLDLTDAEANALLALTDPMVGMAQEVEEAYEALLREVGADGELAELVRHLDDAEDEVGEQLEATRPRYDIVPTYDEGYEAVLIFCRTTREWAELATILGLPRKLDDKGRVKVPQVLTQREFMERWRSRSSSSATAEPGG
jgi:hypothetical protein